MKPTEAKVIEVSGTPLKTKVTTGPVLSVGGHTLVFVESVGWCIAKEDGGLYPFLLYDNGFWRSVSADAATTGAILASRPFATVDPS